MKYPINVVIDFDSTFVSVESLEEFAQMCLKDNPKRESILLKMREITKLGMEGKIPFHQSLSQRFALFTPSKKQLEAFIRKLTKYITPSIRANKAFFKENADHIYIISGGFVDYIYPIVKPFGILRGHILANTFTYNKNGEINGYDKSNPLAKTRGKVVTVKKLKLNNLTVIGDGYTDLEIKKQGVADRFYAFTEHISRAPVTKEADAILPNFDAFLFRINHMAPYLPDKQNESSSS
jgi:D-3-phosphoglycerate dehydrogenase